MRDEKRIEWVASDGGGWKALRLYTGECVRVCAERVTVASGTRRPLYALSETRDAGTMDLDDNAGVQEEPDD